MNKVIVILGVDTIVYDVIPPQTAAEVAEGCGVTDPAFYQEFPESDFDPACYNFPSCFTLSAGVVGFSLPSAKELATFVEKQKYSAAETGATVNYSANQLASQASLPVIDRLPDIQLVLDEVNLLAVQLNDSLAAIDAATTIDEINNIVNPPTGIIFTGRGAGGGPQDLNISYYTEFNSVSMTEEETELYVPGTDTVIPYNSKIGLEGGFDSAGNCFNLGDYLMQIRQVSDSRVIAEFEVPLNPDGQDVPF
jgi:hypothetical protein